MALYIPRGLFHLARLFFVRPDTFGPYYVHTDEYETTTVNTDTLVTKSQM
jgi:hypothetical protein